MKSIRINLLVLALLGFGASIAFAQAPAPAKEQAAIEKPKAPAQPIESLTAAEFSRLSRELSEEGGFFRSDNFTSNETAYLTIVDKLRELGASGGAYVGVGPEQNYTYISKIRPRIAFIMDIRRQAILQHLMYKAVFHQSKNRVDFLALLLSRPLAKEKPLTADSNVNDIVAYFSATPADAKAFTANLATIKKTIQEDFQYPLSADDLKGIDYVYGTFRDDGLQLSYRSGSNNPQGGFGGGGGNFGGGGFGFPVLKDLITATDLNGKLGNFLASNEDWEFVRNLHRKNMIVLVVGNFGGPKALAAIGEYLKKNNFTVTAYYTSNVEQYLFDNEGELFSAWANNVRKLPLTDKSLFIRSASGRFAHPARLPGHRAATLLQQMKVFLKDFDEGVYKSHFDLVTTHYIGTDKP
ncbi:MAG: hypothetical protein HOP19_07680 [Acidobacteria bacterium]|nr:hypothetical protein [Acidobacteriota bacterium]